MRLSISLLLTLSVSIGLSAASVDGIKIHSSIAGKGPKTVILVHGWTCDETTWNAQVPVLSKEYRVVTLDLPGHGQSGAPKDGKLTMELFARAVEAVRKDAKADRVVVVGHSMGTPVVIEYARLFPQHTAALVFVDGLVNLLRGSGWQRCPGSQSQPDVGPGRYEGSRDHDPRHVLRFHHPRHAETYSVDDVGGAGIHSRGRHAGHF